MLSQERAGKPRGVLGKSLRFLLYPYIRTKEDLQVSSERFKGRLQALQESRKAHREQAEQILELSGKGSPRERFENMVVSLSWTDHELANQLLAVRRTKLALMIASCLGFCLACSTMIYIPVWMMLFIAPACLGFVTLGLVKLMLFGLYQAQLETRSLMTFKDYFSRRDFFVHLFS